MTTNPYLAERIGLGTPANDLSPAIIAALVGPAGLAPHTDGVSARRDPELSMSARVANRILVAESVTGQPGKSNFFEDNPVATIEAIRAAISA